MKITHCRITDQPKSLFDPMPQVWLTYEDKTEEFLFSYYPDEISFQPEEFIGLTRTDALRLCQSRDKAFLES
jgi:hypothetical protein